MSISVKKYHEMSVIDANRGRISMVFDHFERLYCAFSGGKDSTVMTHLVMEEAIKRNRKVGLLFIDFEAQYTDSIEHVKKMFNLYKDNIDPYWVCVPMLLRNAVTNFEPQWICWDESKKDVWVRQKPLPEAISFQEGLLYWDCTRWL